MPAALSSPATADEQASCGERGRESVRRATHGRGRVILRGIESNRDQYASVTDTYSVNFQQ